MVKLTPEQLTAAEALFAPLTGLHLSIAAVLAGAARGEVWVDDSARPRVGYAMTTEGHYLVGDAADASVYAALRALIPHQAYLVVEPEAWVAVLDEIWDNSFARRHERKSYRLASARMPGWRAQIPDGYVPERVDAAFLARTDLRHHDEIAERAAEWPSVDDFLARGFGFCIVHGDTIASRCIADCVVDRRCEVGVGTEPAHRRRGLGSAVVAAAVEHCVQSGFTHVGWHCLRSNRGSIAVAERTGFRHVADYAAYSAVLPAENPGDLTEAECIDWALHYERASDAIGWYAFFAAGAWALAGDRTRSLRNVQRLLDNGWRGRPQWLERNWMFASMQADPAFQQQIAALRAAQETA